MGLFKEKFLFKKLWHKVAVIYSIVIVIYFIILFLFFKGIMITHFEDRKVSLYTSAIKKIDTIIEKHNMGSRKLKKMDFKEIKDLIEMDEKINGYSIIISDLDENLLFGNSFLYEAMPKSVIHEKSSLGVIKEIKVGNIEHDYWIFEGESIYIEGKIYILNNIDELTSFYKKITSFLIFFILIVSIITVIFSFRISKWLLKPIFKILARAEKINIENSLELLENNYSEEELRKIINLENSFIQKIRQFIEKEKRFISNASHELITPITIIKGYTEILRWGREDQEIFDNAIDSIENETVRMEELIKALMLLSKMDETKGRKLRPINVANIIKSEVERLKKIYMRSIQIKVEDAYILGESPLIKHLLGELVKNSVKYSEEIIEVELNNRKEMVILTIKDYGIGIPEENLSGIFDRFYQSDTSKSDKGFGLGLAIVKDICTIHNAEIKIESSHKGTLIKIIFPRLSMDNLNS